MSVLSFLSVLPVRSVLSAQNAIRVSLSVNSSCWQHPQQQQQLDCNWRHLIQQDCLSLGAFVGKGACERGVRKGAGHISRAFCFFFYAKTAKCLLRNILRQPLAKEFGVGACRAVSRLHVTTNSRNGSKWKCLLNVAGSRHLVASTLSSPLSFYLSLYARHKSA